MASSIMVFLLSARLLTTAVGYQICRIQGESVFCKSWRSDFCCGTCDDSYCCSDPKKRLTWEAQNDCFFKERKISPEYSPQSNGFSIAVGAIILGVGAIIIWFIIRRVHNPPCGGQPMSTGPPPSYQEAVGPGYPVPIYDGGQAMYPLQSSLPTDYTSPQPAYNPAYTGCTNSVVETSN